MRRLLVAVSALCALVVACEGRDGPFAGGSTGDPGVADFTSIDPEAPPLAPGSGGCELRPETRTPAQPAGNGLRAIDRDDGLWLSLERGLVVDVSDPDALRTRGLVDAPPLAHVMTAGRRRLLASSAGTPAPYVAPEQVPEGQLMQAQVLLLGFDDADAPVVLDRVAIPGEVALVALHESGDVSRAFVVSDEIEESCLAPTKRSMLRSYALEDGTLRALDEMDLGDNLMAAVQAGAHLLLADGIRRPGGQRGPSSQRLVSLSGDALTASARLPAATHDVLPLRLWAFASETSLTVVARDGLEAGKLRVQRIDTSDPMAPELLSDCHLDAPRDRVWPFGQRLIAASWLASVGDGPSGNVLVEFDASCQTSREQNDAWFVPVPGSDRLVEFDFSSRDVIDARLRDPAVDAPVATAALAVVGAEPWRATALADLTVEQDGASASS